MKNQRDKKGKKGGKKSLIPSFLTKLYQILEVKYCIFNTLPRILNFTI
jgi:hypothetical protein